MPCQAAQKLFDLNIMPDSMLCLQHAHYDRMVSLCLSIRDEQGWPYLLIGPCTTRSSSPEWKHGSSSRVKNGYPSRIENIYKLTASAR